MLKSTPTQNHLSRLYFELGQNGARAIGVSCFWPYRPKSLEELLALAAEMSRYDPRLFGIIVEYFYFNFLKINPGRLRQIFTLMTTPQIFGVIGSFVAPARFEPECRDYFEYLSKNLSPVPAQIFFISLYQPGSRLMRRACEESLEEYRMWGFFSRERPVLHMAQRIILGHFGPLSRQNILNNLVKRQPQISLSDYLAAVEHTISRQQALNDLKNCPALTMHGKGRGSIWVTM